MKFTHILGILGGVLFLLIALICWSFKQDSPVPHSGEHPAHQASDSDNRTQSTNTKPHDSADQTVLKQKAQIASQDTLEHRCLQLAEHDPRAAVILAINNFNTDPQPVLLENLVGQWATRDLQASYEWVQEQQPGEFRDGLLERIAFVGSQSDPVSAAQIVIEEMTPGPQQNEAAISVLHQWAQIDLNAAAAWAAKFGGGDFRKRAMAEVEGMRKSRQTMLNGR